MRFSLRQAGSKTTLKALKELPHWSLLAVRIYNRCLMAKEIRLPYSGGVLEQPELLMQIFDVIYDEYSQIREDSARKAEREAKQKVGTNPPKRGWRRFLGR